MTKELKRLIVDYKLPGDGGFLKGMLEDLPEAWELGKDVDSREFTEFERRMNALLMEAIERGDL